MDIGTVLMIAAGFGILALLAVFFQSGKRPVDQPTDSPIDIMTKGTALSAQHMVRHETISRSDPFAAAEKQMIIPKPIAPVIPVGHTIPAVPFSSPFFSIPTSNLGEYEKNVVLQTQNSETAIKGTVLVIDDSNTVVKTIGKILTEAGFKPILYTQPKEAFMWLNGLTAIDAPDLIISDIEMPELNGIELIDKIRKIPAYQKTPIMVVSAHVELHFSLMDAGNIQGFIPKPFDHRFLTEQAEYLIQTGV